MFAAARPYLQCLAVAALALAPVSAAAAELPQGVTAIPLQERITLYQVHSASLGKPMALTIVFPAGYTARAEPWPVLFFLHGLGRHERTLIDDLPSRERLLAQPYLIVLPRGENGWYFDSPFDPGRQYAAWLDEAIALAGKVARLSPDSAHRAIGGWSAGGFGSTWACLRHPNAFSVLATIIAVNDFPTAGAGFPIAAGTFGTDPAQWPRFNPLNRAAELKHLKTLLVIGETAADAPMNDRFAAALTAAGAPPKVVRLPGGHTFPVVQEGLGHVLDFVRDQIAP
jgi:S-formylglutathione hydrolase FrmB